MSAQVTRRVLAGVGLAAAVGVAIGLVLRGRASESAEQVDAEPSDAPPTEYDEAPDGPPRQLHKVA